MCVCLCVRACVSLCVYVCAHEPACVRDGGRLGVCAGIE